MTPESASRTLRNTLDLLYLIMAAQTGLLGVLLTQTADWRAITIIVCALLCVPVEWWILRTWKPVLSAIRTDA